TLDYSQKEGSGVVSQSAAEMLIATATDSGDGLYADEYEPGRYVYKGGNPNNYITFNNESWRILSVENDGTLKIMKSKSIGDIPFDSRGNRDSTSNGAGGTYCAQDSYSCNAWGISDNFVNDEYSGTVLKDAELNTYLNVSYYNGLTADAKAQIQTHVWNVGPVQYYDMDLQAMINGEKSQTWNGNIALMSISDYYKANSNTSQCGNNKLESQNSNGELCKSTNYMFTMIATAANNYVFTITPSTSSVHSPWDVNGDAGSASGDWYRFTYYDNIGVLPTLYLKSNISLDGEGTSDDPYIIVS
ncbi:MAG: hypothetical protein HFH46_03880, partial [Bacilli bacterium]|nr:hypothetical protein [Bacilli bacterium]